MPRSSAGHILVFAFFMFASVPVGGQVASESRSIEFCNLTPWPARAAVGFEVPGSRQRRLEGWVRIWPGSCTKKDLATASSSKVFTFVEAGDNRWEGDGTVRGCVTEEAFQTTIDLACPLNSRAVMLRSQDSNYRGSILRDPKWPALTPEQASVMGLQAALRRQDPRIALTGLLDDPTRVALNRRGLPIKPETSTWRMLYPDDASTLANDSAPPAPVILSAAPPSTETNEVSSSARPRKLRFCNGNYDDVFVAVGYLAGTNPDRWMSHGWLALSPGTCGTTTVMAVPKSATYMYAHSDSISWSEASGALAADFCVTDSAFTVDTDRAACSTRKGAMRLFSLMASPDEPFTWKPSTVTSAWTLMNARIAAQQFALSRIKLFDGKVNGETSPKFLRVLDLFKRARSIQSDDALWAELRGASARQENYAYLLAPSPPGGGLPPPPSPPVQVASVCPYAITTVASDASQQYPRLAPQVITNYWDEFAAATNPAHVASLAKAFRQCLGEAYGQVKSHPHYLVDGEWKVSALMPEGARLLMMQALAELYAPNRADQNPMHAAELVRAAFAEYKSASEGARDQLVARYDQLQREYDEARRKEDERYLSDRRSTLVTSLVGAFLLGKYADAPPDVVSQTVRNLYSNMESYRASRLEQVKTLSDDADQFSARISDILPAKQWTDDGVRLHVVRFEGGGGSAHGPAQAAHDHTRYIVRVKMDGASCSGAMVGPRLVLTAQHCIRDEQGRSKVVTSVRWEYFGHDQARGLVPRGKSARVVRTETSPGRWTDDWSNDWALLELDRRLDESMGYLQLASPAAADQPNLLTVAGYSADIDQGAFITMDWGCSRRPNDESRGVIAHGCTAWKGASGSPIIISEGPNKSQIVGVHAFGLTDDKRRGGGPFVSQFYATWLTMLAAQR